MGCSSVAGIFLGEAAIVRLTDAALLERTGEWRADRTDLAPAADAEPAKDPFKAAIASLDLL
jgi:hypothetical protein